MDKEIMSEAREELQESLNAFIMMPFGSDQKDKDTQDAFFYLVLFGLNDAYYRNFKNDSVKKFRPINLERADIGAGRSADLLGNVLSKIDASDFCVVDCTFENMNVALECGYALAKDKFIIQMQRPIDDIKKTTTKKYHPPHISDLSGKLMQGIEIAPLISNNVWQYFFETIKDHEILLKPAKYFFGHKDEIIPFPDNKKDAKDKEQTFILYFVNESLKEENKFGIDELNDFQEKYRKYIVSRLYSIIRPLSEKLESGGTEVAYDCKTYASRDDANFSVVFSSANKHIKILTTNLQGLVEYIENMKTALERPKNRNKLKLEVLTLNPDSEFVNFRGKLIGKEIARFRTEMSHSLHEFRTKLYKDFPDQVSIKIYSEFPTQITYFVDDKVYSSVVSVNHQSRKNMVFEAPIYRKGVAESFLQHWDTIWARATEVVAPTSSEEQKDANPDDKSPDANSKGVPRDHKTT
jgi:hypothetical protein